MLGLIRGFCIYYFYWRNSFAAFHVGPSLPARECCCAGISGMMHIDDQARRLDLILPNKT